VSQISDQIENRWTLQGIIRMAPRLTRDDNSGRLFLTITLETPHTFKRFDGTETTITPWHTVIFKDHMAERYAEILEQGQGLYVEGPLDYYKRPCGCRVPHLIARRAIPYETVRSYGAQTS
jgi:single-stranded DNA-binding protein